MKRTLFLSGVLLSCLFLTSCGGYRCEITAAVTPATSTADHNASAPGNQMQFSIKSAVTGDCPLVRDKIGSWSTSDTVNTTISNQAPTEGLATCVNATSNPVMITNNGDFRGHAITPATLTCN